MHRIFYTSFLNPLENEMQNINGEKKKGKVIPLQARCAPEGG